MLTDEELENMYGAPLKSPKTRAAALGALNAAAGFLMLNRKTGPCNSVYFEDCKAELIEFCAGKSIYIIGEDIAGIAQTLMPEEAELILINGEAFFEDSLVEEIEVKEVKPSEAVLNVEMKESKKCENISIYSSKSTNGIF